VDRVYLVSGRDEILRRRGLLEAGRAVEAWEDQHTAGDFWLDAESKALLDAVGAPLQPRLSVDAAGVSVYYGPRLRDETSLPREGSLRARVLSSHAIAVAWVTLDRFGTRTTHAPASPADPVFYLRRVGSGPAHVWRWFATRSAARAYMGQHYGTDPQAGAWAEALSVADYGELLGRYGG
jgi:hypothetical protein